MTDSNAPRIGLIVPPATGEVPFEGPALYGSRIDFHARGLGLGSVTPAGYDQVIESVVGHARALAAQGMRAISLMGTSLSFYRGAAFTRELREHMREATGLPCTTMSHAVLDGLAATGVRRVAVATSYIDDVNQRLVVFLREQGLEVAAVEGLGISGVHAMGEVKSDTLVDLCLRVHAAAPDSEGILLSCGGLRTLDVTLEVERRLGVPLISSSPAGLWDVVRLGGLDPRSPGHGRLLDIR
jgi:arylmalonate decarboxylase